MTETVSTVTLLVVDDDPSQRLTVRQYFQPRQFQVLEAENGREAIHLALTHQPDLIVMDVMMPELDGFEACRELRRLGDETPILFLTTKSEVENRLAGLEAGADDYLPKPYSLRELELRVRSILKRKGMQPEKTDLLVRGDLRIDLAKRTVFRQGGLLDLTPTEFKILHLLAARPGQVFSRDRLLDEVWGNEYDGFQRNIDPHINRLRVKLEPADRKPIYILTVWGEGYKFNENLSRMLAEDATKIKEG
ncbi:MAG: response regulator transcription factor [Blastocatellia bacterium]|nr:response regulator transcription factor [Blastocatellia bacterium]HMW03000.1 response regulator transcription factor [Acidobacteriota bacterium]